MAKLLTGIVVSLKMKNTAVVSVERTYAHPMYKKTVRTNKKYKAHIEEEAKITVGDTVLIEETRPLSRDKHFKVLKVVTK